MHGLPTASAYGLICAPLVFTWMVISGDEQRKRLGPLLYVVLTVTVYGLVAPSLMNWASIRVPWKHDAALYRADAMLGLSAFAFSSWLPDVLYLPLALVYKSLPFAITVWSGLHLTQRWGRFRDYVTALIVAYGLGSLLVLIVPACGPAYAKAYLGAGGLMLLTEPANCIPSLHMATALLMIYFSAGYWRIGAGIFAVVTAASTITTGEHYFIDLLVAIPFTAAVVAAVERRPAIAAGMLGLTLGLLFAIRLAV